MSSSPSHHKLAIDHRIGALHLSSQLEFAAPWTVIFGASGSGKSSLLRAACGLLPATFAAHEASGWADLSSQPPHRRRIAYAPQDVSLLPHQTARQNIVFPAAVRGIASEVDQVLDLFSLAELADRMAHELSGGERQRVNLARAFAVPQPRLMLLDEPFTGVDRALRDKLLPRLQAHLAERNIPAISVTHDIEEALLLNAEVIRLEAGSVTAQGPAHEVLADERTRSLRILNASLGVVQVRVARKDRREEVPL